MSNLAVVENNTDVNTDTANMLMNQQAMANLYRFAETMAAGSVTVPKHLQGKTADCLAVAMQSAQWGMNPFAVAQKTHLVNGTLGYEAQLVNAVMQSSGAIVGRFHYEYQGEGQKLSCRVGAIPKGESEVVWNEWLCVSDVTTKNSPLWKTNPKQQLGYLQVKNWGRAYAPGAILGVYTADELQDMPEREINPAPQAASASPVKSSLKNKKAAKPEPVADVVAEQKQDEPAAPDFGDDEAGSEEYARLMDELNMCSENSDFKRWIAEVKELFTAGTGQYTQLVTAYNDRVAVVKAQHEQAQQGE